MRPTPEEIRQFVHESPYIVRRVLGLPETRARQPTPEEIRQLARSIADIVRRVLGLTEDQASRPGWFRYSALTPVQQAEIVKATRPVILAFARRFKAR